MPRYKKVAALLALILAFSTFNLSQLRPAYAGYWIQAYKSQLRPAYAGYWIQAYKVDFTHFDPPYEPHYGAYFSGCEGRTPYFTGPSGAPASYATGNWWGGCRFVLLVSKTWLYSLDCRWGGLPVQCSDRSTPTYHNAYMLYH